VPDAGSDLEKLVAGVEQHLLGEGFTVRHRVREFDDRGVPTAELDVEVTGDVGSSAIRWIFECRDRPSDGPAGVDWIEQLVGRRRRLRPDRIFAVSTTGFSKEAERFAETSGIYLRTVSSMLDLEADFKVKRVVMLHAWVSSIDSADVRTGDPSDKRSGQLSTSTRIRRAQGADWKSLGRVLNDSAPFQTLAGAGDSYPRVAKRVYLTEAPMELDLAGEIVQTRRLRIGFEVTVERLEARALVARTYAEGDRVIGQEGQFEVETAVGPQRMRVLVVLRPDGTEGVRIVPELSSDTRLERVEIYGWRSQEDYERDREVP